MRSALLFLFGLLLGACTTTQVAAVAPTAPIFDRVESAASLESKTVALVVSAEDETRAYCSGVWVSPTSILTANHCVKDEKFGDLVDYVVRGDVFAPGEVRERASISTHGSLLYARDAAHDLALLRALVPPPHAHATVTLEVIRPGMFVQTMGQPLGLWWSYSSGDVAAVRVLDGGAVDLKDVLFVQTTAPTSPGNSGGALFDAYGQIVGICHGSFTRGQTLNLFIHYQYVDALLRSQHSL